MTLLYLLVGLFIYLLPTEMAYHRGHVNRSSIAVVNIALGWTFIGWLAALLMVLWKREETA